MLARERKVQNHEPNNTIPRARKARCEIVSLIAQQLWRASYSCGIGLTSNLFPSCKLPIHMPKQGGRLDYASGIGMTETRERQGSVCIQHAVVERKIQSLNVYNPTPTAINTQSEWTSKERKFRTIGVLVGD